MTPSTSSRVLNKAFNAEFVEIRNGRDYILLIQKYGIDFAVRADEAETLCQQLQVDPKSSATIKNILIKLEEELIALEEEVENNENERLQA